VGFVEFRRLELPAPEVTSHTGKGVPRKNRMNTIRNTGLLQILQVSFVLYITSLQTPFPSFLFLSVFTFERQ
jgi:hypothetical protein